MGSDLGMGYASSSLNGMEGEEVLFEQNTAFPLSSLGLCTTGNARSGKAGLLLLITVTTLGRSYKKSEQISK